MQRSHSRQDNHEHEFPGEDADAEFDGDYVYVYEQCNHAPVINSVTDHERDETYTETGVRCEAQRTANVKVADPVGVDTGLAVEYDDNPEMWEAIMEEVADDIIETAMVDFTGYDPVKVSSVVTEDWNTEQYEVELTLEDVGVTEA